MLFTILGAGVYWIATFYLMILLARMVVDWVQFFAPHWRPRGLILVIANILYALTDPPLRFLRSHIPPLRLGGSLALDIGFVLLFVGVLFLQNLGIMIWRLQ